MKAYDAIENSRANYLLSGNTTRAESVNKLKLKLREKIIHMVEDCIKKLSRKSNPGSNPTANPTAEEHLETAKDTEETAMSLISRGRIVEGYGHLTTSVGNYMDAGDQAKANELSAVLKKLRNKIEKKMRG